MSYLKKSEPLEKRLTLPFGGDTVKSYRNFTQMLTSIFLLYRLKDIFVPKLAGHTLAGHTHTGRTHTLAGHTHWQDSHWQDTHTLAGLTLAGHTLAGHSLAGLIKMKISRIGF